MIKIAEAMNSMLLTLSKSSKLFASDLLITLNVKKTNSFMISEVVMTFFFKLKLQYFF
jgi:hypothetical protein